MDDSEDFEDRDDSPTQPQNYIAETEEPAQFDIESITPQPSEEANTKSQVEFLKERVVFAGGPAALQWPDRTLATMDTFISDPEKPAMFLYRRTAAGPIEGTLHAPPPPPLPPNVQRELTSGPPTQTDLWYFVKREQQSTGAGQHLSLDEVLDGMQFGTVGLDCLLSLQRRVFCIYSAEDHTDKDQCLSEHAKLDFANNLATFLGSLNKACSLLRHQTIFYAAGMMHHLGDSSDTEAIGQTEGILNMEALVLCWLEQAEELLTMDTLRSSPVDNETPVEEIEVWKKYLKIITNMNEQLMTNYLIQQVRRKLKYCKSPFEGLFDKLLLELSGCIQNAQSQIEILSTVTELSRKIAKDEMEVAPLHVANFIDEVVRASKKESLKMDSWKITKLLERVCNAIVSRCTAEISVTKIRQGFMKTTCLVLQENINLCKLFKTLYRQAAVQNEWNLNEADIFQTIDVFVQRCLQLMKVCSTIGQFSRWSDGQKKPVEGMIGQSGQYFSDLLRDIELKFDQILEDITENPDVLTNLKATEWTTILDKFDQNVDFVESLLENAAIRAFETVTTVQEGVEILSNLEDLVSRESILELFAKHTTHIHGMFLQDIYKVKLQLCAISTKYHNNCWDLANLGYEANHIFTTVQKSKEVIDECTWMPATRYTEEVRDSYDEINTIIQDFTAKVYSDWCSTVTRKVRDSSKMLNVPVFALRSPKLEVFECNLDNEIINLCKDVRTWRHIGMDTASIIGNLSEKSNVILELHAQVEAAANDYNSLLSTLNDEDRQFFSMKIGELREIYSPGLNDITWTTPNISTTFFQDCKEKIVELQDQVQHFKTKIAYIETELNGLQDVDVLQNNLKGVIDVIDYKQVQIKVQEELFRRTTEHHVNILAMMQEIEVMFTKDELEKVWKNWWKFIDKIDKKVEDAVRTCVTSNVIRMNNNLDIVNRPNNFRLSLDVNLNNAKLLRMLLPFKTVVNSLIGSLDRISRLTDVLTEKESNRKPIHLILQDNESLMKMQAEITEKVNETTRQFEHEMDNWKPYRAMLEADQDIFFDSYTNLKPNLDSITKDACSYAHIIKIIKVMHPILQIGFIEVNSTELQQEMLRLALTWKEKLHELLLLEITYSLENQCKFVNYTIKRVRNDTRCLLEDESLINNAILEFQHMLTIIHTMEKNGFLLNRVIRSHMMEVTEQLDVLQKIPKEDTSLAK